MQFKYTNNNTYSGGAFLFLKKGFALFALLWCAFFYSQIKISEGATFFLTENATVFIEDSSETIQKSEKKTKIYISSGVQLSNLDSERNYEIVETISLEKGKIESAKYLASKISQPQLQAEIQHTVDTVKTNVVAPKIEFSTQESEVYFSYSGGFSKITIPVSQLNVKQAFRSENYKISLAFEKSTLVLVCFKVNEILTAQNKSAFSVRPPPFLA